MKRQVRVLLLPFVFLISALAPLQAVGTESKETAPEKITLWAQIYEGGWVMIPIGL